MGNRWRLWTGLLPALGLPGVGSRPLAVALLLLPSAYFDAAEAASPSSGNIPEPASLVAGTQGSTNWTGSQAPGLPTTSGLSDSVDATVVAQQCLGSTPAPQCDVYQLTFKARTDFWSRAHAANLTGAVKVHEETTANTPEDDVDVYIFDSAQNLVGRSANGPGSPEFEDVVISEPTPDSIYYVVAYYYTGAPAGYSANATFVLSASSLNAGWGDAHADRLSVQPVDVGINGNEPIVKSAPDGTLYISALQHLYRSINGGRSWTELAGPPETSCTPMPASGNCQAHNLNTDSSIAVDSGGLLYFTFDYPYAGTTAVCTSADRGDNWTCNPAVLPGGTDRMWVLPGVQGTAYEVTNEGLYQTSFFTSTDSGLVWTPEQFGSETLNPSTGPLVQKPGSPNVLQVLKGSAGQVEFYVFNPMLDPTASSSVLTTTRPTKLPPPVAIASAAFSTDGTLYTVTEQPLASTGQVIAVARSPDEAQSWTYLPPVIEDSAAIGTVAFTWVAAGGPGHVGVLFYETHDLGDPGNLNDSRWAARYAETYDALADHPHWTVITLEDNVHVGNLCSTLGGSTSASDCRYSGDFINSWIDANEVAHLTWVSENNKGQTPTIRYAQVAARSSAAGGKATGPDSKGVIVGSGSLGLLTLLPLFGAAGLRQRKLH